MTTNKTELYAALSYNPETDFETIMMESIVDEAYAHMMNAQSALESYLSSKNDTVESAIESLFAVLEGDDGEECECKKKCKEKCEEKKEKEEDEEDIEEDDDEEEEENEDEDAEESTLRAAYEAASSDFINKAKASWKEFFAKAKAFFVRVAESVKNLVTRFTSAMANKSAKKDVQIDGETAHYIKNLSILKDRVNDIYNDEAADKFTALETAAKSKKDKMITISQAEVKNAINELNNILKIASTTLKEANAKMNKAYADDIPALADVRQKEMKAIQEEMKLTRKALHAITVAVSKSMVTPKKKDNNAKNTASTTLPEHTTEAK